MVCPYCSEENTKSTLHPDGASSTLMFPDSYYDENGTYHHHDLNTHSQMFHCSNSHHFMIASKAACPASPKECDVLGSQEVRKVS